MRFSPSIKAEQARGYIDLDNLMQDYQKIPDGYRVSVSLDSYCQSISQEESLSPEILVATNVYQKIQSLPDEELRKYLEKSYKSIIENIEKLNSKDENNEESKPYKSYLQNLINLDRNIDLYNKLDELDYNISQKEQKAYRDLVWFARKGIKLDEDIKEKIFDMYIENDRDLKREIENISAGLNAYPIDIPYATTILREFLLSNPTADVEEIKKEIESGLQEISSNENKKKGRKWKAGAIAGILLGTAIAGVIAYHAYTTGKTQRRWLVFLPPY